MNGPYRGLMRPFVCAPSSCEFIPGLKYANAQDEPHELLASSGGRMVVCHWWDLDELSITIEDATRIVFGQNSLRTFQLTVRYAAGVEGYHSQQEPYPTTNTNSSLTCMYESW